VKIYYSSINDFDWGLLIGKPFVNKMISGLKRPKYTILGTDIAGVIEAVGSNVTLFKPGDRVVGDISVSGWGGFAEYTNVKESALKLIPPEMDFDSAAALPHSGVLALQGLIYNGKLQKGQNVLINGAGGGAGALGIQIAKNLGAHVTAVDSFEKQELMKNLGADIVLDYQKQDFTTGGNMYHLILDNHACHPLGNIKRSLLPGGRYWMVGGESQYILKFFLWGGWLNVFNSRKLKILIHKPNYHLEDLIDMVNQGKVRPTIDSIYSLEQLPKAMKYFGESKAKGKIIIKIQ
jgi:NADPH:quinone reductase-like Zn-dependent oxidoreductase